jgi:hypothetical protein
MTINPDPFALVRQTASKPALSHPEYLDSIPMEVSPESCRGLLFVTEEVYKELGQLVSGRCSKLGRSFEFRYAEFSVHVEGEHLVWLFELLNQGRLSAIRQGILKFKEVFIVIKKVEIMEPQPKEGGVK